MFEPLLVSTGIVALAEFGDKTQLLALMLAARFKRPLPIIAGILLATLINHSLAGALGGWLVSMLGPRLLRGLVACSFILMAVWVLIPDRLDVREQDAFRRFGVFTTTLLTFFLAEMGDKTQVATVALAAHYGQPLWVIAGTTLGMLLADIPAVFLGKTLGNQLSLTWVRAITALSFAVMGFLAVVQGVSFSG
ncbi:transmembrane protein [Legionella rubrilucens]|uniref:GDT1 family protein n=1 Tax=Legionella rubrilucens TaxID=458 RepID=A0A0W0XX41_9GAMM|nr:TMEM165/GDT1 family protein [Legionella rubrilucens]KTD49039.1 transmembrane protein [Legionella rubrilucens]